MNRMHVGKTLTIAKNSMQDQIVHQQLIHHFVVAKNYIRIFVANADFKLNAIQIHNVRNLHAPEANNNIEYSYKLSNSMKI